MNNQSVINIRDQNEAQSVQLIRDLMLTCKDMEFNGFEAQQHFAKMWGIYADHHVYTTIMDNMTRSGKAVCTQGWGTTRYLIS